MALPSFQCIIDLRFACSSVANRSAVEYAGRALALRRPERDPVESREAVRDWNF